MKKCLKFSIKHPAFISALAAMVSASFAIISTCNANKVFEYTKKINKASISLLNVTAQKEQIAKDKLKVLFLFKLSNTGNEPLNILETSTVGIKLSDKKRCDDIPTQTSINTIHPGALFAQEAIIDFFPIDGLTSHTINSPPNTAVIMKIKYKTPSVTDSVTFYIYCDKYLNISHLSMSEYELIKPAIPEGFMLNP